MDETEERTGGACFAYDPAVLRHGDGAVAGLGDELAARGLDHALVVTGETVGTTAAVMDPVRDGLGDRLAGVFAETTPEKRLSTALAGAEAAREHDADALVAVGGGSSLDVATAVATVAGVDRSTGAESAAEPSAGDLAAEFERTGTLAVPDAPLPIVAVPTTFAGADQSQGAGLTAAPEHGLVEEPVDGGLRHEALHPVAAVYDPELFATTPRRVLAGSAANGFDKGLETLYSRHAVPVTDATAARGVARFREGLLAFADDHREGLHAAVEGLLLVQYGISRADCTTLGPIHAVGQALSAAGVHQGTAHAIVAPHVLDAIFERTDGRRALLAAALGAPATDQPASTAVDRVAAVRDALGVPTRLRDVDAVSRSELPAIARDAADHRFLANGPPDFDPTADDLTSVLERAW